MKEKLLEQAKREYSPKRRCAALIVEALFFLGIFPYGFISLGAILDGWLHWPEFSGMPIWLVVGLLLVAVGWPFALWSIYVQFTLGRGTPVPLMATQKLIVIPPYSFCRNPMALGTIMAYEGLAFLFGSLGAGVLVTLAAAGLLVYIKRVEEVEMETRFRQAYLEYKRQTPFLLPRFRRKD